ncbi:phosphatase PAP2 family protein [Maridesulfovibrio sp.]|uniref:phosphatase PAP2 family protein n=1 Tax=Maridesulfovibrio sp. TaxID=2795000 RepID=UPI0039EFA95B
MNSKQLGTYTVAGGLAVLLLIIFFYIVLDRPIAEAAHTLKGTVAVTIGKLISDLASKQLIQTISFFTLIIGMTDYLLHGLRDRSRALLLIAFSTISAMLIGDELKWFFGRCRPPLLFESGEYGFTWFSGEYLKNSFPSGHTLRIFSLTTAIALLLPCKKYIPLIVALLAGCSRVIVGKHYPSDVIFGCYIGITCALWSYYFLYRNNTE